MKHNRLRALALLIALGVASTTHAALAQLTPRYSIAAGPVTATSQTIDGSSHGWGGNAAIWLPMPDMPVGFRADVGVFRFAERHPGIFCAAAIGPCPEIGYRDATTFGTISLTFAPVQRRLSPYFIAGIGAYHLASTETRQMSTCPPGAMCVAVVGPSTTRIHTTTTRFGTSVGGGLAARVGRVSLIAEARYHAYQQLSGNGHMLPITLGVRF